MAIIPNTWGGTLWGKTLWGGPRSLFPYYDDELYLRNFLNDELAVGAAYTQNSFNASIGAPTNIIVLPANVTPYVPTVVYVNGAVLASTFYTVSRRVVTFTITLKAGSQVTIVFWK
jgi:hypothetical protein